MKWKKAIATSMAAAMTLSLAACGGGGSDKSQSSGDSGSSQASISYKDIKLGETDTDLSASIKMLTNRTDLKSSDYAGTNWDQYVAEFNKMYPNIKVEIEGVTDYAEDALLRLQGGDWGDIMMIPEVDKSDFSTYFLSFGSKEDVEKEVNYVSDAVYGGQVYGIPSTAVGRGVLYNKKVFEKAGIKELPKTPEEFINDLKAIGEKTDAIPLYTNYAAGWTMSAWDDYIGGTATGNAAFMNQTLLHSKNPFSDPGNGTGAYNVYKILYDAVNQKLTEDDYVTADWEGSKGMLNNGQIGCMVLGAWAYPQMQQAGDHAEDIGYMPFPITVDGKQYSTAAPDYKYAINVNASEDNQKASMIFIKWMTEKSGFSTNEGGLPMIPGNTDYPEVYDEFVANNVQFIEDEPAAEGEEDLKNELNADSELMVGSGGNEKIQTLIEHAANNDESFDDIMKEWNEKWTSAQEQDGVEVQ